MDVQLSEDLGGIKQMCVVNDLLDVVAEEGKVENKGNPVPVDEEQKGQEAMDGSFGDDVGVQTVAKVDGVNVIAFEIAVHDGEKNLKEQVDGVDQHRQQEQPRFSRHHGGFSNGRAGDVLVGYEGEERKKEKKKQKMLPVG